MAKRAVRPRRIPRVRSSSAIAHVADAPDLALVVPRLQPDELHRLIVQRGLEASADVIGLATAAQLAHVFDIDLWRPARAGGDEQFDAARFGEWLEVMAESGAATAAAILAAQDADLVAMALARHVRVFDRAVVDPYISLDGDITSTGYGTGERTRCDVGGYAVFATRNDAWEAITAVLTAFEQEHGGCFERVMRGCVRLSNSGREIDGLDDLLDTVDQAVFDLAAVREARRLTQGYVAPAEARAFLEMARRAAAGPDSATQLPGLVASATAAGRLADANAAFAFLANALVAGTSMQGRAPGPDEAAAAVAAVCSLGNERSPLPDVMAAFRAGWLLLHEEVCMYTADRLLAALASLRRHDDETDAAVHRLRLDLTKHLRLGTPWCARGRLDVIATLDTPSWAGLCGLVDELPVLPAIVRACVEASPRPVSATRFEFISGSGQIRLIHTFADSLGERLRA
jgi:hypothetical protein